MLLLACDAEILIAYSIELLYFLLGLAALLHDTDARSGADFGAHARGRACAILHLYETVLTPEHLRTRSEGKIAFVIIFNFILIKYILSVRLIYEVAITTSR